MNGIRTRALGTAAISIVFPRRSIVMLTAAKVALSFVLVAFSLTMEGTVAVTWIIVWAFLGYIFAQYGMWKHHRAQIGSTGQPKRK